MNNNNSIININVVDDVKYKNKKWIRQCLTEICTITIHNDDRLNSEGHLYAGDFALQYFLKTNKKLQKRRQKFFQKQKRQKKRERRTATDLKLPSIKF